MSERLDALVNLLAGAPTDYVLDDLEGRIGRTILLRQSEARATAALAPVRLASVGLALAMGITAGGAAAVAAVTTPRADAASAARLAPSNLLEDGR